MDKRYLFIIVIIIVCCVNLYFISSNSDIVGSASVDCNDYTISMPSGFAFYESSNQRTLIHNEYNGMNLNIYTNLDKNDTFENKYKEINSSKEFKVLSEGEVSVDGINIHTLYYQRNDDHQNRSTFYFEKLDHPFRILITDFNYQNDKNLTMQYIFDIVSSLRVNYKNVKLSN